jgi:hypothetical protein
MQRECAVVCELTIRVDYSVGSRPESGLQHVILACEWAIVLYLSMSVVYNTRSQP